MSRTEEGEDTELFEVRIHEETTGIGETDSRTESIDIGPGEHYLGETQDAVVRRTPIRSLQGPPVGVLIEDPLRLLRFDLCSAEPGEPSRGHRRPPPVASLQPLHNRANLAVGDPKVEITPPVQLHLVVHRLLGY